MPFSAFISRDDLFAWYSGLHTVLTNSQSSIEELPASAFLPLSYTLAYFSPPKKFLCAFSRGFRSDDGRTARGLLISSLRVTVKHRLRWHFACSVFSSHRYTSCSDYRPCHTLLLYYGRLWRQRGLVPRKSGWIPYRYYARLIYLLLYIFTQPPVASLPRSCNFLFFGSTEKPRRRHDIRHDYIYSLLPLITEISPRGHAISRLRAIQTYVDKIFSMDIRRQGA